MSIYTPSPRITVVLDGRLQLVAESWDAHADVLYLRNVGHVDGWPLDRAVDATRKHDIEVYADDVGVHAYRGIDMRTDGTDVAVYIYTQRKETAS